MISLLGAAALLAGCSSGSSPARRSSSPKESAPPPSTTSPTPTPTPTPSPILNADERAAVDVYVRYRHAVNLAETDPVHATRAMIEPYAVYPALGGALSSIESSQNNGWKYAGALPIPRTSILIYRSGLKPSVVLRDCPLAPTWHVVDAHTGKVIPLANKAKPPYALTASVEKIGGRWLVRQLKADNSRTCHAP